ncbi:XdhC family protein [Ochrobactrum cytisi]|nr:XdhC family protein [Brucella cytisi]
MHPALIDPRQAAPDMGEGIVIALLTATIGPAYRNPGAAMVIAPDDRWVGALTSGCVEADVALHARDVRMTGRPKRLRYGADSPYFDIRLPCGGAIEIMLFPLRDRTVLERLAERRRSRVPVNLRISPEGPACARPVRRARRGEWKFGDAVLSADTVRDLGSGTGGPDFCADDGKSGPRPHSYQP